MVAKSKKNSKKSGVPFDLSSKDLELPTNCPVLGIPLEIGKSVKQDHSPSLDRFVPAKGYTKDNVSIISWRANHLKNNGTLEEFRKIIKWMEGKETASAKMA